MQFLYQPLTWAFFLVLVPLLIHLINLMRQRRVQWAAMEFLLKSYKKHRRWVWLKQLLLLLLRMLVVALIVAMLAKLITKDEWTNLFSGKTTHHYIVLDDSYSMSDRSGSVEAFDLAQEAVSQICLQAAKQNSLQRVTLVRFSQAGKTAATDDEAASINDLNREVINTSLQDLLQEKNKSIQVSDLSLDPTDGLQTVEQLVRQSTDEKPVVHLVSDFRSNLWSDPGEIPDVLQRLKSLDVEFRFIRCADRQRPNLAIVDLFPVGGIHAAGVPMLLNVKVKNLGTEPVSKIQVKVKTQEYARAVDGSETKMQENQLPDVLIEDIPPGETITRQVQVYFETPGRHVATASLNPDAVNVDNERFCILELLNAVPTLLLDNDVQSNNAYFLQSVFQPGSRTNTGILPVLQPVTYLRDATLEDLMKFSVIYLFDVPQLDGRSRENLEAYVKKGGGLAIFMGPECQPKFYNDWYAEGEGLFPVPLEGPASLDLSPSGIPDIQFETHEIFKALQGDRNPFVAGIRVAQYMQAKLGWNPPTDSTIRVIASLRNNDPFAVERVFGEGTVITFLSSAGTQWGNWAKQPTFIVVNLQAHAYLSSSFGPDSSGLVGSEIAVQLNAAEFDSNVRFVLPEDSTGARAPIQKIATLEAVDASIQRASIGRNPQDNRRTGETDRRGIYEVETRKSDGKIEIQRYAMNVDPADGELDVIKNQELKSALESIDFTIHNADEIVYGTISDTGTSWSEILLGALIIFLLVEQFLAYSAGYHPPPAAVRADQGGAR